MGEDTAHQTLTPPSPRGRELCYSGRLQVPSLFGEVQGEGAKMEACHDLNVGRNSETVSSDPPLPDATFAAATAMSLGEETAEQGRFQVSFPAHRSGQTLSCRQG